MAVKSPTISPFHRDVRDQEPVPQSDEQTSAGPHRMVKVSPEPEAEPGCSSDELFCPGVRCGFCGGPCDKGDWANLATALPLSGCTGMTRLISTGSSPSPRGMTVLPRMKSTFSTSP